jgi:hypothetical protein
MHGKHPSIIELLAKFIICCIFTGGLLVDIARSNEILGEEALEKLNRLEQCKV